MVFPGLIVGQWLLQDLRRWESLELRRLESRELETLWLLILPLVKDEHRVHPEQLTGVSDVQPVIYPVSWRV